MPVLLGRGVEQTSVDLRDLIQRQAPSEVDYGRSADQIDIALINSMPDLALRETERQFCRLLEAASPDLSVRLTVLSMPEVRRGEWAQQYVTDTYADFSSIWDRRYDGVIVTGTEPRARKLDEEPYWATLTSVVDWVNTNSISSIWSCLAAHVAVKYLDGVERHLLDKKCSGVYQFLNRSRHPMLQGVPADVRIPHSRYNGLRLEELQSRGYGVLTYSEHAGVDTFVKERGSLMVFFQGHPEYGAGTLLREYRRDVGRYLRGEQSHYPEVPEGLLDAESTEQVMRFRDRAMSARSEVNIEMFPLEAIEQRLTACWSETAVQIYRNWLVFLASKRQDAIAPASVS